MMPVYWMHETSGKMRDIVEKYFSENHSLTDEELEILKGYVKQWVEAFIVNPFGNQYYKNDLRKILGRIKDCKSKQDLKKIVNDLLRYDIDPF